MRRHVGFVLQLIVLAVLPLLVLWQLEFGFPLIWMPGLLLVGIAVFYVGTRLREL